MICGDYRALATYQAELTSLRRQGFAIVHAPRPSVAPKRTPSSRVQAAADAYARALAQLDDDSRSGRRGVLKAVALQYGVKKSAVVMRLRRAAA